MRGIFWKRIIFTLALLPLIGLCVIVIFWIYIISEAYAINNQILNEHEQIFNEITHPLETSKVSLKRLVIPPSGNGSHCFYFVGEVRSFSGEQTKIKASYDNEQIRLQFFEHGQLDRFPYDWLSSIADWGISKVDSNENYYLVYTLNSRIDDHTSLDFRCR